MKRLCIYLTYDQQKIVDRYIGYMLKELRTCVDTILVVCNETEVVQGMDILKEYADDVFLRENKGLDAGGFKDVICNLYGWDKVLEFDELILINDSFFGPFRPMKDIFAEMDAKGVDFWGLIKHGGCFSDERICRPEEIQSFFIAVCSRLLHSDEFKKYWDEMPFYTSYGEVVTYHEMVFTPHFKALGYTYDCLADVKPNDSDNLRNNYVQYAMLQYEMIKKRNFPFLKKQPISYDTLEMQTQENQMLAFNYIDKETDYDIDMIWENIIRTMDVSDLYRSLHLHYILEEKAITKVMKSVCIVVSVSHKESYEYVQEYLEQLKNIYTIFICIGKEELLGKYKEQGYKCYLLQEREGYTKLLDNISEYDYVCKLTDVDMTSDIVPSCVGKSYFYNIWENLLKNENYTYEVIDLFENNKWLGFLAPPTPIFHNYFGDISGVWGAEYERVKNIAQRMKINSRISPHRKPFAITDSFWIRGNILKKIKDYVEVDFSYLTYLWCYIAQDAGFYSGVVESNRYASMNVVNLQNSLNLLCDQVRRQYGTFDDFLGMRKRIFSGAFESFCNRYEHLYIYGAGNMGKKYRKMLSKIEAYIVSDGEPKDVEVGGEKVVYLSEVTDKETSGIIVCLNEKNQAQVVSLLKEKGYENYICI